MFELVWLGLVNLPCGGVELDKSNPDIHEMIDRLQRATGNDRYYTMIDELNLLGVETPHAFFRTYTKDDNPDYTFDNGMVCRGFRR